MAVTLESYITDARAKNKPNDVIKSALVNAGWPENEVLKALNASPIDPDLAPPPPPPQLAHIGMWTGFLYILFFISLYVLASSIAGLLHNMVDKFLPDIKEVYETYTLSLIHISISVKQIKTVTLKSTMSPGIKLDSSSL